MKYLYSTLYNNIKKYSKKYSESCNRVKNENNKLKDYYKELTILRKKYSYKEITDNVKKYNKIADIYGMESIKALFAFVLFGETIESEKYHKYHDFLTKNMVYTSLRRSPEELLTEITLCEEDCITFYDSTVAYESFDGDAIEIPYKILNDKDFIEKLKNIYEGE